MEVNIGDVAAMLDGRLEGASNVPLTGFAGIEEAGTGEFDLPGQSGLRRAPLHHGRLRRPRGKSLELSGNVQSGTTLIRVADPYAMAKLMQAFSPSSEQTGVGPSDLERGPSRRPASAGWRQHRRPLPHRSRARSIEDSGRARVRGHRGAGRPPSVTGSRRSAPAVGGRAMDCVIGARPHPAGRGHRGCGRVRLRASAGRAVPRKVPQLDGDRPRRRVRDRSRHHHRPRHTGIDGPRRRASSSTTSSRWPTTCSIGRAHRHRRPDRDRGDRRTIGARCMIGGRGGHQLAASAWPTAARWPPRAASPRASSASPTRSCRDTRRRPIKQHPATQVALRRIIREFEKQDTPEPCPTPPPSGRDEPRECAVSASAPYGRRASTLAKAVAFPSTPER